MKEIHPNPDDLVSGKEELRDHARNYFRNAIRKEQQKTDICTAERRIARMREDDHLLLIAQARHLHIDLAVPDTYSMRAEKLRVENVPLRDRTGLVSRDMYISQVTVMDMVDAIHPKGKRALFLEALLDRKDFLESREAELLDQDQSEPIEGVIVMTREELQSELKTLGRAIQFLHRSKV